MVSAPPPHRWWAAALGAAAGCWWANPGPWVLAAATAAAAVVVTRVPRAGRRGGATPGVGVGRLRRGEAVLLAAVAVASAAGFSIRAARTEAALSPPPERVVDGWVSLADDPRPVGPGTTVTVRWRGHRLAAWAFGRTAGQLALRSAGEVVAVEGAISPDVPAWLRTRHVVGRLDLSRVGDWHHGPRWTVAVNRLRVLLASGLADAGAPPLAAGLVIGDDRFVPEEVRDRFRVSGLAHLTAASGQNVALLAALWAPLLGRAPLRVRLAGVTLLVVTFVAVTRFEPSMLRAGVMALSAAMARHRGRTTTPARTLAGAVVVLLAVDPLLVRSVGFALSVSATAGIVGLAGPVGRWLRGPRWFTETLSLSLAAQIGVLPVSVAVFGTVPLVAPLANLAAGPVAAGVMGWGLAAGPVVGIVGPWAAPLHLPTLLGCWWVDRVAAVAAGLSTGWVVAVQLVLAAVIVRRPPDPPER